MTVSAHEQWRELWQRLKIRGDVMRRFSELEKHYSESHRAYHNLAHILDCLMEFRSIRDLAADTNAVEMAIWYHDVVYDPKAKNNEEQSSLLARDVIDDAGLPISFGRTVSRLILATKKHDSSLDKDAPLMVDIDLSILGRSPRQFDEYENKIRQEYNWVSDNEFVAGRTAVLTSFLSRSEIYSTEFFRNKYEQQARENLMRSIDNLQNQKKVFHENEISSPEKNFTRQNR